MKNQYEALSLAALREAAKQKGLKGITALRKQELIDLLVKSEESVPEPASKETVEMKQKEPMKNSISEVLNQEVKIQKSEVHPNSQGKERTSSPMNHKDKNGNHVNNTYRTKEAVSAGESDAVRSTYTKEGNTNRGSNRQDMRNESQRTSYASEGRHENRNQEYSRSNESVRRDDYRNNNEAPRRENTTATEMNQLDSGETKEGILEVMQDGYGFIRCANFMPGDNDVYVSPAQIRRFNLKTGDIVAGNTRVKSQNEKFSALLFVKSVNGLPPSEAQKRKKFEDLTPIFPNERIHLEVPGAPVALRMVDLISPIGKGQRGMIVSQPKTGKTTLLKQIAKAITTNHKDMHLIILLIDERPEEVTDIKESIEGKNVEVIYSTFDEQPENHKRVSEMVIERAKRLVEHKKDVVILLDSITRLARAYNLTVQASGRTLSGGLDPAALHMPKKFFGAARNMREGGSLTILATALVDTGSRMDDVVFEEFKGTGNMELVLNRSLSEKRIFPAIDLPKSSTRRDDLLLTPEESEANEIIRKALNGLKSDEALERIIDMFVNTKNNAELVEMIKKTKIVL